MSSCGKPALPLLLLQFGPTPMRRERCGFSGTCNTGRCILRLLVASPHSPGRSTASRSPRRRFPRLLPDWASGREWPSLWDPLLHLCSRPRTGGSFPHNQAFGAQRCRVPLFAEPMPGAGPDKLLSEPTSRFISAEDDGCHSRRGPKPRKPQRPQLQIWRARYAPCLFSFGIGFPLCFSSAPALIALRRPSRLQY
jgi:hypothetical protein